MRTLYPLVTLEPAQTTPCVFGVRGRRPGAPCAIDRDLSLAQMDAPALLPAGSMISMHFPEGDRYLRMESTFSREAPHENHE